MTPMALFGLPASGSAAPEIRIEHQPGSATLVIDGDPRCLIEHKMVPETHFDLDRFAVFPCYTGLTAESQICELRVGKERNTFGYVFPTTSFRNGAGISEKWPLIYADAAFRKFMNLNYLQEFQAQIALDEIGVEPIPLDRILDDSLSILIVSLEVLAKHEFNEHLLDFLLRRHGVSICEDRRDLSLVLPIAEYNPGLNVQKPQLDLSTDIEKLRLLLKNADRDNSEIGRFVQYYQFIEYMISEIFQWGIHYAAHEGMTAWMVKERLSRLSSERQRLHILSGACLRAMHDRSGEDDLVSACCDFLDLVGIERGDKKAWYSLLYIVRNAVIHNQVSLLSTKFLAALKGVNIALRRVALDTLISFERPTDPNLFFSQNFAD